jgi:ActR/RegA family two-component response regulator
MRPYLLIIDDSDVLLTILKRWFEEVFPEKPVLGVKSIAEAKEAMAAVPIDFFLVDYSLPDGSGLDFIRNVRRGWPEARFILMTLEMPPAENKALMSLNPVGSFRKPVDLWELEWALRPHLDRGLERTDAVSSAGFKTMVRGILSVDLIQLKCNEIATCALQFHNLLDEVGRIYLDKGEIMHAETQRNMGIDALAEIILWQDGAVQELSIWTPPTTVTIGPPWQSALMEAARLADGGGPPDAIAATIFTSDERATSHENLNEP